MIEVLYNIAVNDKTNAQAALNRYTSLVAKSAHTSIRKYQLYRRALEIASDVKVQNRLINLLGETHTYQALMLVEKYMDNKATAEAAAEAVRTIASKNSENFGGEPVRKAFETAILRKLVMRMPVMPSMTLMPYCKDFRRQPTFRYSVMPNGQ